MNRKSHRCAFLIMQFPKFYFWQFYVFGLRRCKTLENFQHQLLVPDDVSIVKCVLYSCIKLSLINLTLYFDIMATFEKRSIDMYILWWKHFMDSSCDIIQTHEHLLICYTYVSFIFMLLRELYSCYSYVIQVHEFLSWRCIYILYKDLTCRYR